MLKKQNRLKNRSAFSAIYYNGESYVTDSLVLYTNRIKTDKNCPTRVGFVVSKKVHKRAVKRNRIKRLLRENIRLMLKDPEYKVLNMFENLVFIARKRILGKSIDEVRELILILFKKVANKQI